jgi:hypothetical protein
MNRRLLLPRFLLIALAIGGLALGGCGGGDDDDDDPTGPGGNDRNPAEANPTYVAPADRIDPAAVTSWTDAQFVALGEARSGRNGPGTPPATTRSRYVSATDGDDDGPGTQEAPWRTVQHAADTVAPGTTVYIDASADHTGGLAITRSGARDQWIVFTAWHADQPPRLTGAGLQRDAIVDVDASWIVVHGLEIADHDRGSLADDEIGIQIEPRRTDIDHVWILGNHVHHIGPPDASGDSCSYDAHGIIAQSDGLRIANLIIEGNELNDLYVGNSECLVVNGLVEQFRIASNYVHHVNNIAIDVIGYEKNPDETTSHGLVADNVVLDASNYWPYCTRGNCTYPPGDESSDGIYVDGGALLEIAYNVVGRTDHGIELQSENGELIRDVLVHHNAVFNSNYRHLTIGPAENVTESDNVLFDEPSLADPELEDCLD